MILMLVLVLVLLQCFKKRGVDDIVDWDHPRLLDIYCIFAGNSLVVNPTMLK